MQANTAKEFKQKIKKSRITTTQLRQLLSHVAVINNKIAKTSGDTLSEALIDEIHYMHIKFVYQCGREKGVKHFDNDFDIQSKIQSIGASKQRFKAFYRYLEEIVAYTKYYRS